MTYGQAAVTNAAGQVADETASELTKLIALIITKIPLWIAAFIVIVVSVLVAKIAQRIVINKMAEKGVGDEHEELQILGGRLTHSGVLILGITIGLKIAGIDLTTIIAAGAFGIGFALKDMIMNFLAGVMILVGQHFMIGDFISVGSTLGKVVEIQSRVTILKAVDGTKVIVPNADLFKKQVTSFTSNPFRRIEVRVGVDYRNNLENALRVAMNTVHKTKGILLEPKPGVLVDAFEDSGVAIKIKAWVDSKSGWIKIKSDLVQNIKTAFDEHGIVIPWPIRTIVNDNEKKISEKIAEEESVKEEKTEPVAAPNEAQTPQPVVQPLEAAKVLEEVPLKPLGEI